VRSGVNRKASGLVGSRGQGGGDIQVTEAHYDVIVAGAGLAGVCAATAHSSIMLRTRR
jgi:hypothetical protein